ACGSHDFRAWGPPETLQGRWSGASSFSMSGVRPIAASVTVAFAIWLLQACGSKAPKGVADVPECRHAAPAITESKFDTRIKLLTRQADAYSECMVSHGYVLDEQELSQQIEHVRQVENAKWLGGDPYFIIAKRRQQLRMSPALWRPSSESGAPQTDRGQ